MSKRPSSVRHDFEEKKQQVPIVQSARKIERYAETGQLGKLTTEEISVEKIKKEIEKHEKSEPVESGASFENNDKNPKIDVLLENLELTLKIDKVETVQYLFQENVIRAKYQVSHVKFTSTFQLVIRAPFEGDPTRNLREGYMAYFTALRLALIDNTWSLMSSNNTVFFIYSNI